MKTIENNQCQTTTGVDGWFNRQAENFEKGRFFWMAIYLTSQSCLGSIACGYILKNEGSLLMLGICATVTMGSNAVFIALGSPKLCLAVTYTSYLVNAILIVINI